MNLAGKSPHRVSSRMATNIALLRGVNVGGNRKVAMSDLRAFLSRLGLGDPRSLLQSGNVVFRSDASPAKLEAMLEAEAGERLGLQTTFFVRTAEEWRSVVARNPFRDEAASDPSHLVVMFLKEAPDAGSVRALQAAIVGPEVVRAGGRHAYITYPAGIGDSRLTAAVIDRMLGTRGTGRNWNTVLKLGALAGS
jgi:uncharacterized protein (DUF1697 family)